MTPTPEDELRAALRDEADGVWPAGSYDEVHRRRRQMDRRARVTRAAVAVVAVVGLVGIALSIAGRDDSDVSVVTPPVEEPEPTASEGIWPFTTADEAADGMPEAPFDTTDPVATAEAFLRTVAGLAEFETAAPVVEGAEAEVSVTNRTGRSSVVRLARLGGAEHWTVTSLESDGIVIDELLAFDEVTAPVRVAGRATAFEGTVQVAVLERVAAFGRPWQLGDAVATGEQGDLRPFATDVTLDDVPDHGRITVIAFTTSAEDGGVDGITAVPATVVGGQPTTPVSLPTGAPLAGDEVVAVVNLAVESDPDEQAVVVLSADDGQQRRTLLDGISAVDGGVLDLALSADRRTVLVSLSTSACTSEILAVGTDGGGGEPARLGAGDAVALSPDGSRLAAVVYDACGEDATIEVRPVGGGAVAEIEVPGRVAELVWAGDDRLTYETDGELVGYDLGQEREIGLDGERPASSLTAPARHPSGAVSAVVPCCGPLEDGDASVVLLDPATGEITGEAHVFSTAVEVASHWWQGGEDDQLRWLTREGELFRVVDDGPVRLATGLAHAAG